MHKLIAAIVPASDERDALIHADGIFSELCGDGKPYDYHSTFDEGWARDRWGELFPAKPVGDPVADQLVSELMESRKKEFMRGIEALRARMEAKNDEEVYMALCDYGEWPSVDYALQLMSGGHNCCYIYGLSGAVLNPVGLKSLIEEYEDQTESGEKLWVVPADVHY